MKKFSYVVFLGAFIGFISAAHAQEIKSAEQVIQNLNNIHFIKGKFAQEKTLKGISQSLKSQGRFMFWKNHGLFLATDKPFFNAMSLINGNMISWKADGAGTLSQEQNALVQREINKTLFSFFSADIPLIEQRFNTQWDFSGASWKLKLTPKMAMIEKSLKETRIAGQQKIDSIDVVAANGDTTHIQFSDQTTSPQPSDAECHWFAFPAKDRCSDIQ